MKYIILKIRNIIIGWYRYLFKSRSEMAKKRLAICKNCPHKIIFSGHEVCDLCYCVLAAKAEVEDEKCYDNRWEC